MYGRSRMGGGRQQYALSGVSIAVPHQRSMCCHGCSWPYHVRLAPCHGTALRLLWQDCHSTDIKTDRSLALHGDVESCQAYQTGIEPEINRVKALPRQYCMGLSWPFCHDTALALHSDLESWKAHQSTIRPGLGYSIGFWSGGRGRLLPCHCLRHSLLYTAALTATTIRSILMGQLLDSRMGGWDSV